jgi:hypothetical protein
MSASARPGGIFGLQIAGQERRIRQRELGQFDEPDVSARAQRKPGFPPINGAQGLEKVFNPVLIANQLPCVAGNESEQRPRENQPRFPLVGYAAMLRNAPML